jgi:hypothetical protein
MKKALNWLSKLDPKGTYTLGFRCQVWAQLPDEMGRDMLARDATQLIRSIPKPHPNQSPDKMAIYTYVSGGKPRTGKRIRGDHSNTQIAHYGAWAAARKNIEIPTQYWQLVYKHWALTQNKEGGWGYGTGRSEKVRDTMTAAGLASLFVAADNLFQKQFVQCGKAPTAEPIRKALDWFDRNFWTPGGYWPGPRYYYLYAVERVGLASGYKYFGKKDWYKTGAKWLLGRQNGNGSWQGRGLDRDSLVSTSFALLFLVRGRAPVMFNRLEYEGDWNNRPRALANLTRWVGDQFEKEVNWQIINLKVPVEEWHDAPILMITGSRTPKFEEKDLDKLRRFVWQGGTLFSVAECMPSGRDFDRAMRKIYGKLFPLYELQQLPLDHPIYSTHFRGSRVRLWAVTNGARILALHTTHDLPRNWQVNERATARHAFELPTNVSLYVNDRSLGRPRGTSPWPEVKDFRPVKTLTVARVKYSGNWDPEPLAWERFGILYGNDREMKVTTEDVAPDELNPKVHTLAHVTGTRRLPLDEKEQAALKAYVAGGGTLLVDVTGGDKKANAVALVEQMYGQDAVRYVRGSSEVYSLPDMAIDKVHYTRAARMETGGMSRPRFRGVQVDGRMGVIVSDMDLTAGLVGYPSSQIRGYTSESAYELVRNILTYAGKPPEKTEAAEADGD